MKDNHEQIEALLNRALEFKPAERPAFLAGACGGNNELRDKVETLLAAAAEADGFMEGVTVVAETPLSEAPGTMIGRYKLLQKIGEGGMGVVYMAEQTEPVKRKVALKIIKLGMDTRQVVARFEAERQALAMMDHPNIARVLDGGSTEPSLGVPPSGGPDRLKPGLQTLPGSRPYFVMELVQGVPITEYCDKNKLTAKERLELFIPVCQAIQSAHQKGIIHRDIKPSNVMVSLHHGEPMPKVIDFGIAKATNQKLTEKTLFTNYAQMIGTPAYMSPEQAEMSTMDVDTRTDVYSLGVLLYELLTGTTPFLEKRLRSAGYGEMQRIIAEEEPEKPSTRMSTMEGEQKTAIAKSHGMDVSAMGRLFKGDLDWITMKCLEKDRRRRYDTPNELVSDLKRHLNNEPVSAAAPTFSYQFQKFYRKNRSAMRAAAVVAGLLVVTSAFSTYQAVRASRAERRANEEAKFARTQEAIAKAVNEFWNEDILAQADPDEQPDRDIKLREVLDRAAESIEGRFPNQPLVEAAVRLNVGRAYKQMGEILRADPHLRRAFEIRQRELEPDSLDALEAAYSWIQQLGNRGRSDEQEALIEESIRYATNKHGPDAEITLKLQVLRAVVYRRNGDFETFERIYWEILEGLRRALGEDHEQTLWMYNNLGSVLLNIGRRDEAKELLEPGVELAENKYGPDSDKRVLSTLRSNLGRLYLDERDRKDKLVPLWEKIVEQRIRRYGLEHYDTQSAISYLERSYRSTGDLEGLTKLCEDILERLRATDSLDPTDLTTQRTWFKLDKMTTLLRLYLQTGRMEEFGNLAPQVEEYGMGVFNYDPGAASDSLKLPGAFWRWAQFLTLTKGFDAALPPMREVITRWPQNRWNWYLQAAIEAMAEDMEGYLASCRRMLSLAAELQTEKEWRVGDLQSLEITLKTCALMSASDPSMQAQKDALYTILESQIADDALVFDNSAGLTTLRSWLRVALALKDYRDGNYGKAIKVLEPIESERQEQFDNIGGYGLGLLIRAMSQFQLGDEVLARATLAKASDSTLHFMPKGLETDPRGIELDDQLRYYVVRKEAEALILGEIGQRTNEQSGNGVSTARLKDSDKTESHER